MIKNKLKLVILLGTFLGIFSFGQSVHADVDDFHFDSMHVDYELSRDSNNRSVLNVFETLKPIFPNFNQNRGIIRAIPTKYDNHSLSFKLDSIHRDNQSANIYKKEEKNDHMFYTIRDSHHDSFLFGLHEYKINYQLRDVTHQPKDSDANEFYWDVNGTEWLQRFDQVSAKIKLSADLQKQVLDNQLACYTGKLYSTERNCQINYNASTGAVEVSTTEPLTAKENLSFAIGFKKDTFAPYQKSPKEILIASLFKLASAAGFILLVLAFIKNRQIKSAKPSTTIVTQYIPSNESDFYIDTDLTNPAKLVTAGLLNLAVCHKIQIIEKKKANILSSAIYQIKIIDAQSLSKKDRNFLQLFFNSKTLEDGAIKELKNNDRAAGLRINRYTTDRKKRLTKQEIYQDLSASSTKRSAVVMTVIALVIFFGTMFIGTTLIEEPILIMINLFGVVFGSTLLAKIEFPRLTMRGAEIKTYNKGLERYIKYAETDKIQFAQGLEQAERRLEAEEPNQETKNYRIVLYERLLPYAVLFGLEKSWAKQLEKIYQNEPDYTPNWYVGTQAFNAARFSQDFNAFSSSFSSSSSSYNSSNSGSSGSGFSGGGGGGGGGGGC